MYEKCKLVDCIIGDMFYTLDWWENEFMNPTDVEPFTVNSISENGIEYKCFSSDSGGYKFFGRYIDVIKITNKNNNE